MTVLTEGLHPGEPIMAEGNGNISRENMTIAAEQTILANALVARRAVVANVAAAASANAGNTGQGAMTLAEPAVSPAVKDGVYRVTCIQPDAGGGTFQVEDPNGNVIGISTVGDAFDGEVKFTIADGEPDFAAGDRFAITVETAKHSFEHVAFDPEGTDGAEVPVAYSIYPVATGEGETKKTAVISRLATLNGNCIAWPEGITNAQKVDAIQALEKRNIIIR